MAGTLRGNHRIVSEDCLGGRGKLLTGRGNSKSEQNPKNSGLPALDAELPVLDAGSCPISVLVPEGGGD